MRKSIASKLAYSKNSSYLCTRKTLIANQSWTNSLPIPLYSFPASTCSCAMTSSTHWSSSATTSTANRKNFFRRSARKATNTTPPSVSSAPYDHPRKHSVCLQFLPPEGAHLPLFHHAVAARRHRVCNR